MIIGVWLQPTNSFAKWKARGINTLVGWKAAADTNRQQYIAAANAAGLKYILEAGDANDCKRDQADPNCTALLIEPDEPDGGGNTPPTVMQQKAQAIRAAGFTKPLLISFEAVNMIWKPTAVYLEYLKACDWCGEDVYPANQGSPLADKLTRIRMFKAMGRKVISFVECSEQGLTWPAHPGKPDVTSFVAQVQAVNAEGVEGIIYFPQRIAPDFVYDATAMDVAGAMQAFNSTKQV